MKGREEHDVEQILMINDHGMLWYYLEKIYIAPSIRYIFVALQACLSACEFIKTKIAMNSINQKSSHFQLN